MENKALTPAFHSFNYIDDQYCVDQPILAYAQPESICRSLNIANLMTNSPQLKINLQPYRLICFIDEVLNVNAE